MRAAGSNNVLTVTRTDGASFKLSAMGASGQLGTISFHAENHVGFIAEEVPELVAMNDRQGLSPMDIVAVLTKVVQEQQKAISKLQDEITKVKKQVQKQR